MIGRTVLAVLGMVLASATLAEPDTSAARTTWAEVGSLLANRCTRCHSGDDAPEGLDLGTYDGAISGSRNGPVMIAGLAHDGTLMRRIVGPLRPRMPLDGPPFVTATEIALLQMWIRAGMPRGDARLVPVPVLRTRPAPGARITFADVAPVLGRNCIECHSANSRLTAPPKKLRLDTLAGVLAGGERIVVLPGDAAMSPLWRRVQGLAEPRMPHDGPPYLAPEDVQLIADWIDQGALDGAGNPAPVPVGAEMRLSGRLSAFDTIDGAEFDLTVWARILKLPRLGQRAEMWGRVTEDGRVTATMLRAE